MAESGGPIFEGSARPETVKKGVVDRLKEKWGYTRKAVIKGTPEYFEARAKWKQIGPDFEKAQLDAAEKILNILGDGKLRQAAELTKPMIKLAAKVNRVSAVVPDVIFTASGVFGGLGNMLEGTAAFFGKGKGRKLDVVTGGGQAALMLGLLWLAPTRRIGTKVYETVGNLADRVNSGVDKILHRERKPKPMAT